jgi:hypothetical protein
MFKATEDTIQPSCISHDIVDPLHAYCYQMRSEVTSALPRHGGTNHHDSWSCSLFRRMHKYLVSYKEHSTASDMQLQCLAEAARCESMTWISRTHIRGWWGCLEKTMQVLLLLLTSRPALSNTCISSSIDNGTETHLGDRWL